MTSNLEVTKNDLVTNCGLGTYNCRHEKHRPDE